MNNTALIVLFFASIYFRSWGLFWIFILCCIFGGQQ